MASIDDVSTDLQRLLDALIRMKPYDRSTFGQVGSYPGLVPQTYRWAGKVREDSEKILAAVTAIDGLLNAVNEQTLGRIEQGIGGAESISRNTESIASRVEVATGVAAAASSESFAHLGTAIEQITSFLQTVRDDIRDVRAAVGAVASDVQALDAQVAELQKSNADLSAQVDALVAAIQTQPH
jgi:DNA anti-recombination protein RmuC